MDYESKLKAAHQEFEDKGVWPSNYNPPMYRLLRNSALNFPHLTTRRFGKSFLASLVTSLILYVFCVYFIILYDLPFL
ncbi:MAG: DUF6404 family protein [Lactococcus garvieae]